MGRIKQSYYPSPELTRRTSQNSNLSNLSNTPKKGFRRVFFNDFSAQEHTLNAPLTPSNPSFCLPLLGPASGISVASTETPVSVENDQEVLRPGTLPCLPLSTALQPPLYEICKATGGSEILAILFTRGRLTDIQQVSYSPLQQRNTI
ncbi:hypothetical protein V497_04703 [Pseudogymnoascus sp. VKM F-4516 (FW-969)]|nr:hypothetical protein V497_04703 [Pseudogymnoascus sp. VKM F-4516 (FW-969)]